MLIIELTQEEQETYARIGGDVWLKKSLAYSALQKSNEKRARTELQAWLDDKCVIDETARTGVADLYHSFIAYHAGLQLNLSKKAFSQKLMQAGFRQGRALSRFYYGIGLKDRPVNATLPVPPSDWQDRF